MGELKYSSKQNRKIVQSDKSVILEMSQMYKKVQKREERLMRDIAVAPKMNLNTVQDIQDIMERSMR